jgi:hypothetical protein
MKILVRIRLVFAEKKSFFSKFNFSSTASESNDAVANSKQIKQTEKNSKRKFFSKMEDF